MAAKRKSSKKTTVRKTTSRKRAETKPSTNPETEMEQASSLPETSPFVVDGITVRFPATISVEDATSLQSTLKEQLLGCAVVFDVSRVEIVDTSIMQLLAGFSSAASDAGLFVEWENIPPAFSDAACTLGLADTLGLPVATKEVAT